MCLNRLTLENNRGGGGVSVLVLAANQSTSPRWRGSVEGRDSSAVGGNAVLIFLMPA